MGGFSSGRWHTHSKARTTSEVPLTLRMSRQMATNIRAGGRYTLCWAWKTGGLPNESVHASIAYVVEGCQAIRLEYLAHEQAVVEHVEIATARLTFGERLFWRCPGCGRRAGILYGRWGRFRCRTCHGLTYTSCQEADKRAYALARDIPDPATLNMASLRMMRRDLTRALLLLKARDVALRRQLRELRRLGVDVDSLPSL
jgi:hypothetical protein